MKLKERAGTKEEKEVNAMERGDLEVLYVLFPRLAIIFPVLVKGM